MKHFTSPLLIVLAVLCMQVSPGIVLAQPAGQIMGKLTDARTGNPVAGATVFLSQTMRAALTGADGTYHLEGVPTGTYDLVATADGYFSTEQQAEVLADRVRKVDFIMKQPLPSELPAPVAPEKRGRGWKQGLNQFEKLFFGNTANAKETRILNPEVLDFSTDRLTGIFKATATKPLLVENRALGYRMTFVLQSFALDPHRQVLSYTGRPYFAELEPNTPEEKSRWEEIRQQTWYGSLNHLLASLARNRLEQEGYVLKKDLMREEQQGQQRLMVVQSENMSRQILDEKPLRVSEILRETQRPGEFEMAMAEYVRVIYRGKVNRPTAKYRKDRTPEEQISWILMQTPWAVLYQDGSIYPSNAIRVHGYMAGFRIAEMMPREYLPPTWREGLVSN